MIIDTKIIIENILKNARIRTSLLRMQRVYPSLVIIRTTRSSKYKYYMDVLKQYCEYCNIKLDVVDVFSNNKEKAIQVIDKYNNDFNVHGIILETPNENLANNIVPFKDVDCLSIPNVGSLMTREDITQPCIAKGILSLLRYEKVPLDKSKVLIVTDDNNNHYIKYLTEILRREKSTIIIANNNTHNLSSLFYDSNIILIANKKANSIGYDLLDDVNYHIEQRIIHGINNKSTYIFDLDIHKNRANKINGNLQYNNLDYKYKFDYLTYLKVLPVWEYVNLALCSLLENTLICANIQNAMMQRTKSNVE
jgi:5,10-methylene-tetrahydrofolate dehydrogenase/methenyl tetrahydrofolate cyclohydrolase